MAQSKASLNHVPLVARLAADLDFGDGVRMKNLLKQVLCRGLAGIRLDHLFRFIHRHKILVVMYHGVTESLYRPSIWTQLPVDMFRRHIDFLRTHYTPISLSQLLDGMSGWKKLPENSALVTFDDGLKNNFTVAFPILREAGVPAAIFLTTDYIGTNRFLWVDELYVLLREALECGTHLPMIYELPGARSASGTTLDVLYPLVVEKMKRMKNEERERWLERLRDNILANWTKFRGDFGFLSWEEVRTMADSGLIEFGVHTANHSILSHLSECELEEEVGGAKNRIETNLNRKIPAFCYPNGIPDVDFTAAHRDYLRQRGFQCAFSTDSGLHSLKDSDHFMIKRIPVGSDMTSDLNYFRLNAAGVFQALIISPRRG